jgi:hypothetical protein
MPTLLAGDDAQACSTRCARGTMRSASRRANTSAPPACASPPDMTSRISRSRRCRRCSSTTFARSSAEKQQRPRTTSSIAKPHCASAFLRSIGSSSTRLLVEARLTYRMRDERTYLNDTWSAGIARRAMLAAGARLVAKGRLHEAEHAVELTPDELDSMLAGGAGPSADESGSIATYRTTHTIHDAPRSSAARPPDRRPQIGFRRWLRVRNAPSAS